MIHQGTVETDFPGFGEFFLIEIYTGGKHVVMGHTS